LAAIAAKIKYYKERTVEEYTLLVENDPFKLESQINNCLNQGWVLHGSVVVAFTDKQQWFHYQAMVRSKSAELAATVPPVGAANSRYATALDVVQQYVKEVANSESSKFVDWLYQRLNPAERDSA
jgi:hypothetical protein